MSDGSACDESVVVRSRYCQTAPGLDRFRLHSATPAVAYSPRGMKVNHQGRAPIKTGSFCLCLNESDTNMILYTAFNLSFNEAYLIMNCKVVQQTH